MSHRYHPDPAMGDAADGLVFDDCPDCTWRADAGIEGLLPWDDERFNALWNRMLVTEYKDEETHRSKAEQKTCRTLYLMALLMERHMPGSTPWERRGA